MKLAQQDDVAALDADFGAMAMAVGRHAWELPTLTMREKAFVFLAADLCSHCVGFPLRTHITMALSQGVSLAAQREALRHLAPYVGYPAVAEALMVVAEMEQAGQPEQAGQADDGNDAGEHVRVDVDVFENLRRMDPDFADFLADQMTERWNRPGLSLRERALCTIATDVCQGTLDESFRMHVDLARAHGAGDEPIRAVLLLVAEFGIAKAWRAYRALPAHPTEIGDTRRRPRSS